jgi:FkbM family methyltransferase
MFELISGVMVRSGNVYDRNIVLDVLQNNRYHLPDSFSPHDIIIDIGAHVGSFATACLQRGAGKVFAFEPDRQNIRLCAHNLRRFGNRTFLSRAAIWRSDLDVSELKYTGYPATANGSNSGGGNVVFDDGHNIAVRAEALDSILSNIRKVRLLKLDCESSEWPILLTCRLLDAVEDIAGEFHEIGGYFNNAQIPTKAQVANYESYVASDLVSFLGRHGFSVQIHRNNNSNIGLFFAKRENVSCEQSNH